MAFSCQAGTLWEVASGYVGCARLVMPLTNLNAEPCSLELEEALLTVRPRRDGNPSGLGAPEPVSGEEENMESLLSGNFFDYEEGKQVGGDLGLDSITAGVTRIAGGIETILQKLRVKVIASLCLGSTPYQML